MSLQWHKVHRCLLHDCACCSGACDAAWYQLLGTHAGDQPAVSSCLVVCHALALSALLLSYVTRAGLARRLKRRRREPAAVRRAPRRATAARSAASRPQARRRAAAARRAAHAHARRSRQAAPKSLRAAATIEQTGIAANWAATEVAMSDAVTTASASATNGASATTSGVANGGTGAMMTGEVATSGARRGGRGRHEETRTVTMTDVRMQMMDGGARNAASLCRVFAPCSPAICLRHQGSFACTRFGGGRYAWA
jgi:hypothetical protein